jgi:hypothetical protein
LLAAAAISRFASTYDGLARGFLAEPEFAAIVERDVRDGQHRNPERHPDWFTTAYFHHPDELREEVVGAGFEVDALLAVEGAAGWLGDLGSWLDDDGRREALMAAIRRVESEPSLLGASPHLLALAHAACPRRNSSSYGLGAAAGAVLRASGWTALRRRRRRGTYRGGNPAASSSWISVTRTSCSVLNSGGAQQV